MVRIFVWSLLVCLALAGCASTIAFPSLDGAVTVRGKLSQPAGSSPLPAVVLLAPCYGIAPFINEWARWLKTQGYVALVVDSYAPRHSREACLGPPPSVEDVAHDAIAAVAFLKTLPSVDGERIAIMGWSHGASAALKVDTLKRESGLQGIKSLIAFYPGCDELDPDLETETLLFLAGHDDWTPPDACLRLGETMQREGRPLTWQLYPGATHSFDERDADAAAEQGIPNRREVLGHQLYYDLPAARDAHAQVRRFLAKTL